jgi:hypothetical protein
MRNCTIAFFLLVFTLPLTAQSFDWSRSTGSTGSDVSRSMGVDAAGNVYTTGTFTGTVDFDPGAGTFMLTASGSSNIYVQKLSATGNFVWAKAMLGTDFSRSISMVVDAAGNVYSTGFYAGAVDFDPGAGTRILDSGSAVWRDFYVLKLDASGNLVWAHGFGGVNEDIGYGITLDANGNVLVTGGFESTVDFDPGAGVASLTSTNMDIFVQKLDAAGNFVWAKSMTTTGFGGDDYGAAIATDATGNVYLSGIFGGEVDFDPGAGVAQLSTPTGFNGFVEKLDASGNFVWVKQAVSPLFSNGLDITVCANGDVLASGIFKDDIDGDPGAATVTVPSAGGWDGYLYRLTPSGNLVWFHSLGGPQDDYLRSLAEDLSGNVFIAGDFQDTVDFDPSANTVFAYAMGASDIFVQQLSGSGAYISHMQMGGTQAESCFELVNANQSQYLAGYFSDMVDLDPYAGTSTHISSGSEDAYVLKLNGPPVAMTDAASHTLWTAFPNPTEGKFQLSGLERGSIRKVCVTNAAGVVIPVECDWQNGTNPEIDLGSFPAGMYFVAVWTKGAMVSLKVVKD